MSQICTPIPENCENCIEITLNYTNPFINTGLTTSIGDYYFWTIDQFGNTYQDILSITYSNQTIQIDTTQFPPGLFFQYSGSMDFFITTDSAGNNMVPITYNYNQYNCFILQITCNDGGYNDTPLCQTENNYLWVTENGNYINME